ncbi:hypothetical protein FZC83_06890 [Rossellomorea marisflavi]|uniref:Uncharacterized protein n=1 Tax=Rossellomorea marisflavi TaxID=189381 RepID=A0A5D4RXW0_9BACI|nr:SE1561 family protein [Rossellomorea marisflavi]KQU63096.1 hypothetical protein ASG66_01395 [Bacillus sp. Leaf406]MBV6682281.1 hypothetical protein [Bacillus sp. JRC01]VXC45051.1 conserved hypothetical protein [Bacillus sp. 349Y]MDR4938481.1 SE1561 family protein [Rossellomorea marisflavi]MDW4525220.1 SE1561 family protein [Rossellomorea marisflavi]
MGKAIQDNESQVTYLKQRLNLFVDVLDSIDPEQADIDDIDRLIEMIDDIETKVEQFKKSE